MLGTAEKMENFVGMGEAGCPVNAAAAQLLESFHAMQPQFQRALLDIAEVYAERYPIPKGVYIV